MKQIIKLMINCAAVCACASVFGYSNPIEGGSVETVTNQWNAAVPWLMVGGNSSSNMLFVSNGGQVNNQIGIIGNTASSMKNFAIVSGSNAVWNSAMEVSVGNLGSSNSLAVFSGGRVNTANAYIGKASSNNFAAISGVGSELSAASLHVGHTGSDNSIGILDGGAVSSGNASLGHWIGSDENSVLVMGTNSVWNNSKTINIGEHGSENSLIIMDDGTVQSSVVNLGVHSYSSSNTLSVMGENARLDGPELNIGGTATTAGGTGNRVSVFNGGTVATTNLTIHAGNNLDVNDGGTFAINNDFDASMEGFSFNAGGTLEVGGNLTGMGSALEEGRALVLNGSSAQWDMTSSDIKVGEFTSDNSLTIVDGGQVESINGLIGHGQNSVSNQVVVSGSGSMLKMKEIPPSTGGGPQVTVASGYLYVGMEGQNNSLTLLDGAVVENLYGVVGGMSTASNNKVQVSGVGSQWRNSKGLYLGGWNYPDTFPLAPSERWNDGGISNTLSVQDGGWVLVGDVNTNNLPDLGTSGGLVVGDASGATEMVAANESLIDLDVAYLGLSTNESGSVLLTGGTQMDVRDKIYIGYAGDGSTMTVSDGATLNSDTGFVGFENSASGNVVNVSGGTWSNSNELYVGYDGSGNELNVMDGGQVFNRYSSHIGNGLTASNNSVAVSGVGSVMSNGFHLYVGDAGSDNSMIIADGGTVAAHNGYIGYRDEAAGNSVIVSGEGSTWTNGNYLRVGYRGSDNSLSITNGGAVSGDRGSVGSTDGAINNEIVVSGAGSLLSMRSGMSVGASGKENRLLITDGGRVEFGAGGIGSSYSANDNSAVVTGEGSTWQNTSDMVVGGYGERNMLEILDGGTVTSMHGYVGKYDRAQSNAVFIAGEGSVWSNSGVLHMGWKGNSSRIEITDGGKLYNAHANVGFATTSTGNGVSVSGAGSEWRSSDGLHIGQRGAGNSVDVLDGGRVESRYGVMGYFESASNNTVTVSGHGSVWKNHEVLYLGGHMSDSNWVDGGTGNALSVSNSGWVLVGEIETNNLPTSGNGGVLAVGDSSGTPEMIVANGSRVESSRGFIGLGANESGSVVISGAGSVWDNTVYGVPSYTNSTSVDSASLYNDPFVGPQGDLSVGYAGSGNRLVIMNGGRVESSGSYIGHGEMATNNSVVVSGEGSTWDNSGQLNVGYNGSGNTLRIEDGGVVTAQSGISIGYGEGADGNQVVVSGEGSSLRSGWYSTGTLPPGIIDGPFLTNLPPTIVQPPYTTFDADGAVISGNGNLTVGNSGSGNTLTVTGGTFTGGNSYIGGATSNNNVVVSNGGSVWSNTTGLVITGGTFTGGIVSNVVIVPPVLRPNPVLIMTRLGELAIGRGGSDNSLLIEDGAQVYSMGGMIGQRSNAWNNAVSVVGTNSAWHNQSDLSLGGRMADYIEGWNTPESQTETAWFDGGRNNSLYVGDGAVVNVGRDLHNRNYSSVNVDPRAAINVANNYYQDATSSLRFGVETNSMGAPLNALVTVGGTAEFKAGARIEYASNVGQLQFDTFYTNKIIEADKLIVAGVEDAGSLDLEMLDASGTLVDVIFWENEQDIYGLVGRNYLADSAGFNTNSMMGALSKEIDELSLLGDAHASRMINLLNTMAGSQQAAQLMQQYSRGVPAYQHSRSMTEGMNEIKKHTASKNQVRQSEPEGAQGPYRADQELQGWIKPYGLWADHAARDGFSGYDQSVYGTVVGFDFPLKTALLGVAGGYGHSSLSQNDGDESSAKTGYGVIYLNWGTDDWFYDVNMGFGRSSIEQESGTSFNNSADYDASNFALQLGGGKEMKINRCWAVTPKASALWTYYYQEAYTETSSQGVERMVEAYDRNSLLSRLGAAVSWQKEFKTMTLKPEARLYWLHEFNDDVDQVDYELANGMGGEYHFLMAAPQSDVLEAGLGITWVLNGDLQFVFDVDGRFGEDYSAYALSGRAVVEF